MAVRVALGASRRRLALQLLTESLFLSSIGGIVGLLFALAAISTVSPHLPADLSRATGVALDGRILVFTVTISLVTGVLFGLGPMFGIRRVNAGESLKRGDRVATGTQSHLRSCLAVAQIAIAIILLIGAGLFVHTLWNLRTLDRGFRHEGVLLVDVDARRAGYEGARLQAFNQEVLAIAERLPGVTAASLSSVTPLMGGGIIMPIAVNGQRVGSEELHFNQVAPRYFETLGNTACPRPRFHSS